MKTKNQKTVGTKKPLSEREQQARAFREAQLAKSAPVSKVPVSEVATSKSASTAKAREGQKVVSRKITAPKPDEQSSKPLAPNVEQEASLPVMTSEAGQGGLEDGQETAEADPVAAMTETEAITGSPSSNAPRVSGAVVAISRKTTSTEVTEAGSSQKPIQVANKASERKKRVDEQARWKEERRAKREQSRLQRKAATEAHREQAKRERDLGPEYNAAALRVSDLRRRLLAALKWKAELQTATPQTQAVADRVAAARQELAEALAAQRALQAENTELVEVTELIRGLTKQREAARQEKRAAHEKAMAARAHEVPAETTEDASEEGSD